MIEDLFDNYYFQNVFYCAIFILFSFVIIDTMKKKKINIKDKFSIKNIDYKFLIKITCLSFFLRIIFEQFQVHLNLSQTDVSFEITLLSIIFFFVARCIVAPITEEIIFRFGLYELMNRKMKSILAIILSSLIFSILHGYLTIDTILLTVLSIIWTYSYFKKKNLLYPIILHFLHNCYALISYANINNSYYIIFGIITFIVWLLLEINKKRSNN